MDHIAAEALIVLVCGAGAFAMSARGRPRAEHWAWILTFFSLAFFVLTRLLPFSEYGSTLPVLLRLGSYPEELSWMGAVAVATLAWRLLPVNSPDVAATSASAHGRAVLHVKNSGRDRGKFYATAFVPYLDGIPPVVSESGHYALAWRRDEPSIELSPNELADILIADTDDEGLFISALDVYGRTYRAKIFGTHDPTVGENTALVLIITIYTDPRAHAPWVSKLTLGWDGHHIRGVTSIPIVKRRDSLRRLLKI